MSPSSLRPLGRRAGALAAALVALLLALALPAHAGRACAARMPDVASVQRGLALAEQAARALDDSGAKVVVLARAGQDLSRYGLRWSHLGLAYRDGTVWRVVHKLNECGSGRADLFRQGLGEFFLDDMFEYRAAFVVLAPALQERLLALLRDDARAAVLHEPAYNMVAYPWARRYQQSNQWAIETIAFVESPEARSRDKAQAWLQLSGFEPAVLRITAMTRLGARMTAANIAFDDHPNEKRFSDRIETVSVESVFRWLSRRGLSGPVQVTP